MNQSVHPIKCRVREDAGVTRVDVYDDIGGDGEGGWFTGLTAKDFSAQLTSVVGPLDIHINSAGGSVPDGIAIANAVRAHKGRKRTIVDGMAASIASIIMQAGDERIVEPGSMVMIHDASTFVGGTQADLQKTADALGKHSDNLAKQYADRAGGSPEQWRDIMRAETWYTAEEAVAAGLADRVGAGSAALPRSFDLAAFHAVPGRFVAHLLRLPTVQPEAGSAAPRVVAAPTAAAHCCGQCGTPLTAAASGDKPMGDGWVMGSDGTPRFDPDGDGDDDATPEGDTDNDYFDPDGKQIKEIPPMPGAAKAKASMKTTPARPEPAQLQAATDAEVDNSAWDAAKAWHNGTQVADPETFYKGICAGKRTGDPDTQAAWALPYKYHPDDPPNAAGVRAALARLSSTKGLINKTEAVEILEAAMKTINPDYKPGDMDPGLLSAVLLEALEGGIK